MGVTPTAPQRQVHRGAKSGPGKNRPDPKFSPDPDLKGRWGDMWLMFLMKCWRTDTSHTQAKSGILFNSLGYQGLHSISLALSFLQTFNQNGGEGCVCTGCLPTRTGWAGHGRPDRQQRSAQSDHTVPPTAKGTVLSKAVVSSPGIWGPAL